MEPDAVEHDKRRTAWLLANGFHVIRFRNQELDEDIHKVVATIERAVVELEAGEENGPRSSQCE